MHQLHPSDLIAYTAAARIAAQHIERMREPIADRVACSYRIQVNDDNGSFFDYGTGFDSFTERSLELANDHSHVLILDISDFYNQIYLHRVQGAIYRADPSL